MPPAPIGTITFVFTDIEGSSQRWERFPEAMALALVKHDTILREAFESRGGLVFKTVGDAFCVAFDTAAAALDAALEAQRLIKSETWEEVGDLRVRMAVHTGAAELRDGDYFGPTLNRVSRILATGHGGQALLSQTTQELVRDHLPQGARLRHLGEHRLRDLARPEHLFQLVAQDLPSEFPPLRSLENVPNNLPIQLTTFVGREREIAEVKQRLEKTHLLTLTGPGGTGKTRLSLQVAADLLDSFADGVWLVEFAAIDDAALVIETVAAALDLRQEADRPLATSLAAYLRAKKLLLILDNCEHVVEACARLVELLLRSCPHLRILASSREALGIAGEMTWLLPPLSLPEEYWRDIAGGPDAIDRLMDFEAVRLFVERATMARPSFRLTNENVLVIAQICWRLDGIPLAIELAAARTRVLTLTQIAERLDDRFHLLTTGSRTAVPRQQTLRSLIDWSHDLLSEPERTLFRRLCVFARGRTLEAIEQVCAGDGVEEHEIVDLLTQLVDKSLVQVEKAPGHGPRYVILESLWDYSNEKLEASGESARYRERHLDYFVRFAEEAAPHIIGPEQATWLKRLEPEDINLRFATETSWELPGQVEKGLRLLTAVTRFVEVRGLFKEARTAFQRLLAHPDAAPHTAIRAAALAATGRLAWVSDDLGPARECAREALAIYQERSDSRGTSEMLASLALSACDDGDLKDAASMLSEAAQLAESLRDRRLTAHVRHAQATVAAVEGDYARSYALDAESYALYRELGDAWLAVILDWAVGISATVLGRFDEASAHFTACLENGIKLSGQWGLPFPLEAFATLAAAEQKYVRAARLLGAAETLRSKFDLPREPVDHPVVRSLLAAAAVPLASAEAEAARRAGREMSVNDAIAFALAQE